ncbi:MAG TPA: DUF1707 domain-containing protein [Streptosporangiaceae bacterium]|jgi:hypothetical protein|nr:DUF1707 domain-containing protein [Streptosporangiaceae bacterium]
MDDRQRMRASDRDRQEVVDRLRDAVAEGRLKMDEYMDRMGRAYQAVTYGDLATLHADLPAVGPAAGRGAALPATAPLARALPAKAAPACDAWQGFLAGQPGALRVLWTSWLAAVSINVVVWALVSATTGHLIYPWPLWVAGPWGAALFAVSAAVAAIRHVPPSPARRLPSGKA